MTIEQVFKQFFDNVNKQGIEISDKTNIYQCMDLAYAWAFVLSIPKSTLQHRYAYEVYKNPTILTRKHFELIANTDEAMPQAGDLVVWDTTVGVAGHIAIANGASTLTKFTSFDQNWGGVSSAILVQHNYKGVIGWLRPKESVLNSQLDPVPTPVLQGYTLTELDKDIPTEIEFKYNFKEYSAYDKKKGLGQFRDLLDKYSLLLVENYELLARIEKEKEIYQDLRLQIDELKKKKSLAENSLDIELQKTSFELIFDGISKLINRNYGK